MLFCKRLCKGLFMKSLCNLLSSEFGGFFVDFFLSMVKYLVL